MRLEDLVIHTVVFEFEDADIPIAACASQKTAGFVGRPGDYVYGCGVQGEIEDFGPGGAGFPPDEDFPVVAGGGEDVAVFGVGPGDRPYCSFVSRILLGDGGEC
jgi:hypothetical protein